MRRLATCVLTSVLCLACGRAAPAQAPDVLVVEGESFRPLDDRGWKLTHQDDSYASATYGGMWLSHGGCLGAPAASAGSVAARTVTVTKPGRYRVWSKYQAPPYFNYLHKVEVVQGGKTVFAHVYGRKGTDRLWSFSGTSDELWWPWGVDHDAAEPAPGLVDLQAGPAELRLSTVANAAPAGDRFIDLLVLTTNPKEEYEGYKPYKVGSPFALEACAATELYLRFQNVSGKEAQLTVARNGHFQPNYGGAQAQYPGRPVAPGQWSEWVNVGPFCRLVHDEGLFLTLPGADAVPVQFARDREGKDLAGDCTVASGSAVSVPIDIVWNKKARVRPGAEHAREIIAATAGWRKANGGKKPREVLFYGAFRGKEPWITELKAALGYNTELPEQYEHVRRDQIHTHAHNEAQIRAVAAKVADPSRFRVMSFGDEISLGSINFKDPKIQDKFRAWLATNNVTRADLGGFDPASATLADQGNARLAWHAQRFNEEERFAEYRRLTELTKQLLGPDVLTGANYSPHHGVLYYGPIYQWVDIFKHKGMSLFWTEDYIFLVPEVPQIISFLHAQIRCATKYHGQPVHFYVMPHSPGQEPAYLRRNTLLTVGNGTAHVDHFWVAPAENFTENYVAWNCRDMFRAIYESIYDTAEAEQLRRGGKVRPARVAVVTGRATDHNERNTKRFKAEDPFARVCKNAPEQIEQNLCRKDQQMLYLALRHAQHAVDAITEDDVVEGYLKDYDVVYFAGEWIDERAVPKLEEWVRGGGVLYASAGLGHRNQFNEPSPALLALLGLKSARLEKSLVRVMTLLDLPLAEPAGTVNLGGERVPAVGMKQTLEPASARVIGTWDDGSAAVTVRELGQGQAVAVGTCAGISWMKTALKTIPYARGGRRNLYNPVDFSPAATKLARLGVDARPVERAAECGNPAVEAVVLDGDRGTLLTLVNWDNAPQRDLEVRVRLPHPPRHARSVRWQQDLPVTYENGVARFRVNLEDADYLLLPR